MQFVIQFALSAAAIVVPGLLALNLGRRPSRISVVVQLAVLLALAAWLAWAPWNNPDP
jgi:hypothetical protein